MRILILTILLLTKFCSFGQNQTLREKKDQERIVKNKIKSVTQFTYSYTDSSFEDNGYKSYYEEYDKKGNTIKSIDYWPNGQVQNQDICFSNRQGLIDSCIGKQFDPNGQMQYSSETFYDTLGLPIKTISYENGIVKEKEIFNYDKAGRVIKEETMTAGDIITYILTYEYDERGFLTKDLGTTSDIDENGSRYYFTDRIYIYSYDKNGNEISSLTLLLYDQLSNKTVSVYDKNGNQIEYRDYDSKDVLTTKQVFTYDKNNNQIDFEYISGGKITTSAKKKYNEKGLVIEETSYDSKRPTRRTKYTYDYY